MSEYRDLYRRAANGEGQVVSFKFTNVHPRAIVQIVHDISEHSLRYREFASALNDAGFYVCGNDLIGHGMRDVYKRQAKSCMPGYCNHHRHHSRLSGGDRR